MLKGKVALVTGAAKGIGKAIALELAEHECQIIIHYNKSKELVNSFIKKLEQKGFSACAFSCDLTKEVEIKKLFQSIDKKFNRLDFLINNVGNFLKKDLNDLKISEWQQIIDSNLNSTFYCTKHFLPLLRESTMPRIVNIGYASTGQIIAKPSILPYQIAKTGVLLLTKALAKEEAKNGILVNMISPGIMENTKVPFPKDKIPLGKAGSIKEFAKFVRQVIENTYVTGAHIESSGGFNL